MLLLGDCNDHLKEINDNSIDLLVTDPPYFLINDSGSGFMGKDWDSINDSVGLSVLCKSKEFASFVLKFFQLMRIGQNTGEVNSAPEIARTTERNQNNLSNSTAQYVVKNSTNGKAQSKANINSVPDYVLTKDDLSVLLNELLINPTTVLESLPENVLFVIPYSYLKNRLKNTAAENVLKSPIDLQCEDNLTPVSSTDAVKINDVIEAMIGSVLDYKSTNGITTPADYARNIVEGRKYKHIILLNTNKLKTIHWIIWLLYVISVIQRRNTIPNSTIINYDLIYQFHKSWASQAYRVLKQGKLAFIMCSPRQDVINITIQAFQDVGFKVAYTSLFHAFASGFPKAKNNGDGSYQNFSPKPAVEIILVVSKGKTLTWLDDCRIPYQSEDDKTAGWHEGDGTFGYRKYTADRGYDRINKELEKQGPPNEKGRFPANLLCSDDVLNDGRVYKSSPENDIGKGWGNSDIYGDGKPISRIKIGDSGSYSRYFSLDSWAEKTFPFLIVAKASKAERNKGVETMQPVKVNDGRNTPIDNPFQRGETLRTNSHPTVKPLKLMSYLITMGSREGDLVLDPFCGSGTVCIAADQLHRKWIGIEKNPEYAEIIKRRLMVPLSQLKLTIY